MFVAEAAGLRGDGSDDERAVQHRAKISISFSSIFDHSFTIIKTKKQCLSWMWKFFFSKPCCAGMLL